MTLIRLLQYTLWRIFRFGTSNAYLPLVALPLSEWKPFIAPGCSRAEGRDTPLTMQGEALPLLKSRISRLGQELLVSV